MATAGARGGELRWVRNSGRNDSDGPADLLPNQSAESWNVVLLHNAIAQKRHGAAVQSLTGDPLQMPLAALARFVPGQDDRLVELHVIDSSGQFGRIAPGGGPILRAFPDAPLLDTFDRPDEDPLAHDWGSVTPYPALRIESHQVTGGAQAISYYKRYFDRDFQVFVGVPVFPPTPSEAIALDIALMLRTPRTPPEAPLDYDGFVVRLYHDTDGTSTLQLAKVTNGVMWDLVTQSVIAFQAGDAFGVARVGSTFTLYWRSGGTWTAVATGTNAENYLPLIPCLQKAGGPSAVVPYSFDNFGGGPFLVGYVEGLSVVDSVSQRPQDASWAQLNGKLYWAYDSGVDRLHVYDPATASEGVRRTGLAYPPAPSVANTGSGTYPAVIRWYRTQMITRVDGTLRRASELGPAVAFTPSGSGTGAVVSVVLGVDLSTHWRVWGSNGGPYYLLTEQPVSVPSWTDTTLPTDYANGRDTAPEEGAFTNWPSVKYLVSTGERLLGFGSYEPGGSEISKPGRVYFSPVLDTTDFDDDERVSHTGTHQGWIDIARNAGGEDRALAGPVDGNLFVLQSRGLWMLVPTGDDEVPYRRVQLSPTIGALSNSSTFVGEDENGAACLYWLDPVRGPYRYGAAGLQWCGYDMQRAWTRVNQLATTKMAHGVYDPDMRACLWWVALDGAEDPTWIFVFFVCEGRPVATDGVRNGWVIWGGEYGRALSSVLYPKQIGYTMSRRLQPYIGHPTALLRGNDELTNTDAGSPFSAYVISRAWDLAPVHHKKNLEKTYVQAVTARGVVIDQELYPDYGKKPPRLTTVNITPKATEPRVLARVQESALAGWATCQVLLGQKQALDTAWQIDSWIATSVLTDDEV